MTLHAVVLAAGKGTRMRSELPKVLFPVGGRPMLSWVLDAVGGADPDRVVVVVGHEADRVTGLLPDGVESVVQAEQLGTGHATRVALEAMGDVTGDLVLVVPGDTPLYRSSTLAALVSAHRDGDAACTLLTTRMPDPTGYGRVLRDGDDVVAIVEERDATADQRAIDEVAVATYVFDGGQLADAVGRLRADNDQGEEYLTDVVAIMAAEGGAAAVSVAAPEEVQGINSHEQLAAADREARRRINADLMEAGVWMQDPERTYVDASVTVEPGARLYAGVHLEGATSVAAGAVVGPEVFAIDSSIGADARVWYAVLREAEVGERAEVGPYASLRPGTVLGPDTKVGTFVETKNTELGAGSKVPHLSYLGDATVGTNSNIGAGTITCNYDGFEKHRTVIGDDVFIGSDTMLVAPVEIGDGAYTGAGSVITRDVDPGSLAVERSHQKQIPGYAERRARLAEAEDS